MNPARSPQLTGTLPIRSHTPSAVAATSGDVVTVRDHLDQLHHRRRVEEVHADHVGGPGRGHGALHHRQRGRGRRQDRARLADLVERGEHRALDVQLLDDGLDDEVDVAEVLQPRRAGDPGDGGVALVLGEPAAHHALVQRLAQLGERRRHLRLAAPAHHHVQARFREHLDDARRHPTGADHADALDVPHRDVVGHGAVRGLRVRHHLRAVRARVGVEAAAALAALQPRGDHLLEDRRGGVQQVARLRVHRLEDLVRGVQPDEVQQRQRAHRVAAAVAHGGVEVLAGGVALLVHPRGVVEVAEEQRVGDEARAVADHDGHLVQRGGERLQVVDDVRLGHHRAHQLDQPLHGRGVEEVHADQPTRASGAHRELGDRERRRVRREDDVGAAHLVQLAEHARLELEVLGNGLDDEIGVGEVGHRRGGGDPRRAARRRPPG